MAKNIIIDTGFWYALHDKRDEHYDVAQVLLEDIMTHTWLVPWPTLYETLNTSFVGRSDWLMSLESFFRKDSVYRVEDDIYRETAYGEVFPGTGQNVRRFSLVDLVIREMLKDEQLKIDALLTFDRPHYLDLCRKREVELLFP